MSAVLFVCTANCARSAFAAAVLAKHELPGIEVMSAGTLARTDRPADLQSLRVATDLGFDLESHRSTKLRVSHMRADLILCMTNEHVRHSVGLFPGAWKRTFTLVDFVTRSQRFGSRGSLGFDLWATTLHDTRALAEVESDGGPNDIADPVDFGPKMHREIFEKIRTLVDFAGRTL